MTRILVICGDGGRDPEPATPGTDPSDPPGGDARVPTLAPVDALEHVAQHGRKEAWPYLRHLIDVVDLVAACGDDTAAALVRRCPNVRDALGTASSLAPWLGDIVDLDRGTRRRCRDAWTGCLALDRGLHARRAFTGRDALRARLRHEWWLLRSAPSWSTRLAYGTRVTERAAVLANRRRAAQRSQEPRAPHHP